MPFILRQSKLECLSWIFLLQCNKSNFSTLVGFTLITNMKLGCKYLPIANTLAYFIGVQLKSGVEGSNKLDRLSLVSLTRKGVIPVACPERWSTLADSGLTGKH